MKWKVRLTGDERGLEELSESFSEDPEVFEDENNFFLWSSNFEDLEEVSEVKDIAERIVLNIRNLGLKDSLRTEYLHTAHIHEIKDDGTEHVTVIAEVEPVKVRANPVSITTTDQTGNKEVYHPADRTYELTKLALEDEKVQELVGLLDKGNNWVNLYRIYEFIQAHISGDENIVERGWWSSNEKDRFKRTANSRDAIGDNARHGQERIPAPENTMIHSDAKGLVDNLIDNWLEHRRQL